LSNQGWQDGGMDTENGVLELWSNGGTRNKAHHFARTDVRIGTDGGQGHDSAQVVDFPHLIWVRVFLRVERFRFQSQANTGTNVRKLRENGKDAEGRRVRVWVTERAAKCA
jgi:hypothetical protein